jgi:hypothetical protein
MLVRFSSTATEPLIMFGDVAIQLIKMMGASGAIPGALYAADIPAAITRLRQQLALMSPSDSKATSNAKADEDNDHEPSLALSTRAVPLIELLERAAQGNAPFMWDAN